MARGKYTSPSPKSLYQHADLTVLLLNARSVRNEKAELLHEHFKDHNADIVLLTETWLKEGDRV